MKKTTKPVENATAENTAAENTTPDNMAVKNATAENATPETMNPPTVQNVSNLPYTAKDVSKRGKAIRAELLVVEKSFLKIAFNIHWFYRTKAFESVGYKNIYDMTQAEFNIKRTLANNYINVIDRFAKRDENGEIIEEINEVYKAFCHSQLIAMLGRSDEELEEITADMSVRKIKEALKALDEDTDTAVGDTNGTAPDKDTDTADEKEAEVKIVERQILVRFNNMDEYSKYLDGMNDYIEAALKKGKAVEVAIVK